MKHFLFRKQVLNWEYLLSIPSLLVRLPVTVANDVPEVYRAREVILGFFVFFVFFVEVSLNSPWRGRGSSFPRLSQAWCHGPLFFYVYVVDAPVGAVRMRYVWLAYKFKLQSKVSSSR